ncbi:MAG: hypothetical protein IKS11_01405, partial [Lachnospiraceae bacterium]|nr:hypothetical protein [Lachnospiraceae bacterium]
MRRAKRLMGLLFALVMLTGTLAACGNETKDPGTNAEPTKAAAATQKPGDPTPTPVPAYETLDKNVSGDISIMVWSGDSVYYEDLGHKTIADEELTSQNVAAVYALAKAFNQKYPNVKINLWAKADDPNGNDTSWYQEMENFKAEHGKYPDVYASTDLAGDVAKGL